MIKNIFILTFLFLLSCVTRPIESTTADKRTDSLTISEINDKCVLQIDTLTKLKVYKAAEKMPEVQGGMAVLYKEVNKKLILPSSLRDSEDFGGVNLMVAFIVKEDGSIVGKRVIRNVKGTDLAAQYLNILTTMKWQSGWCNGKKVSVLQVIPMCIELE